MSIFFNTYFLENILGKNVKQTASLVDWINIEINSFSGTLDTIIAYRGTLFLNHRSKNYKLESFLI